MNPNTREEVLHEIIEGHEDFTYLVDDTWVHCTDSARALRLLGDGMQLKIMPRKPRKIYGNIEVPKPICALHRSGDVYWYFTPNGEICSRNWIEGKFDKAVYSVSSWRTKREAEAAFEAWQKFLRG